MEAPQGGGQIKLRYMISPSLLPPVAGKLEPRQLPKEPKELLGQPDFPLYSPKVEGKLDESPPWEPIFCIFDALKMDGKMDGERTSGNDFFLKIISGEMN